MAKRRPEKGEGHQLKGTGAEALHDAQAKAIGTKFEWHFGRVTRMGNFEPAGGRGVTIIWEEGRRHFSTGESHQRTMGDLQTRIPDLGPYRGPERHGR